MKEILAEIESWLGSGEATALATVVQTWGAAATPARPRV